MYYKYNTNLIYNTSYLYFNKFNKKKNIFLNFRKNNKLIRKMFILLLFNFYLFCNNISFFKISLPDFISLNYKFLNLFKNKSFNFFYFL